MATDSTVSTLKKVVSNYKKRQEDETISGYDPAQQVQGYKDRIEGSGLDVEKETDNRTLFEKAFNLPDEQNPLFDVFEIINRPQQAIFGAIKASQEGQAAEDGFMEGLTGNERTRFKEITNNAGITTDSGDKFGADDVFGFVGDVFLDPADLALFPVAASAKAAKIAKLGKAGANTADGIKAAKAAVKGANSIDKTRKSLTMLTLQGIGTGFKKTISLADTGAEHFAKWLSADIASVANKGAKEVNMLTKYRDVKEMMRKTFDFTKGMADDMFSKVTATVGGARFAKNKLNALLGSHHGKILQDKMDIFIKNNPNYTVDEVSSYLRTILEHGTKMFKVDGAVIDGLVNKTSMRAIFKSDAWLINTGIDKRTMEMANKLLDDYFPNIRKNYISNGTASDIWLRQSDSTGVINDTFRIADENLHKEIKKALDNLDPNSPDMFIKGGKKELTTSQIARRAELEKDTAYIKKAKESGAKKAIPAGSEQTKVFREKMYQGDKIREEYMELTRVGRPSKKYAGLTVEKRRAKALKLKKQEAKNIKELNKLMDDFGENIDDVILKYENELAPLMEDGTGVTHKMVLDKLDEDVEISPYLTKDYKSKIEAFAQDESVPEMLNAVSSFMNETVTTLQEVLEFAWVSHPGYFPHTITDTWKKLNINKFAEVTDDSFASTRMLKGDAQAFATRKYKMSTVEANATAKNYADYLLETRKGNLSEKAIVALEDAKFMDMFETDLKAGMSDFITRGANATADAKILETVLSSDVFDVADDLIEEAAPRAWKDALEGGQMRKNNFVRKAGQGEQAPWGYSEVSGDSLARKLEKMAEFSISTEVKTKAKNLIGLMKGERLFVDNNIYMMIGRATETPKPLVDGINLINNLFKKNKLLSPGFQMRNIVGNLSNLWLSGVGVKDVFRYTKKSYGIMAKGDELFKKMATGELTYDLMSKSDTLIYKEYEQFVKHGFADVGNALRDIPEELWNVNAQSNHWKKYLEKVKKDPTLKPTARELASFPKNAYNKLVSWNMAKNQTQDGMFRMAAWRYAKDNPDFVAKAGYKTPEEYVRKTLFDFNDLSLIEKNTMRKIIPFYTFTKKNLAFQMRNMMQNGNRYNKMVKTFNNLWDGVATDEDSVDKFKVENFWIPIPGIGKDGKYMAIKSSLPLGDLGEFLDTPLQRGLASTAPLIRAPFEIGLNKQMFSGMPIQEFKGQKGYYIPEIGKKAEYGLSQFGLDVPAAAGADIGRTLSSVFKGEAKNPLQSAGEAFGRTVISQGDTERTATRNAYNELDELQGLMRYYKQEGIEIKTLDEIENEGALGKTRSIIQKLREINGQ